MPGYRDLTFRRDFPELADDCYVVYANPALEPFDRDALTTPRLPSGDIDEVALFDRGVRAVSKLVVEWQVWDKDGNQLPLPTDPETVNRCPSYIWNKLREEVSVKLNPTPPEKGKGKTGKTAATEQNAT